MVKGLPTGIILLSLASLFTDIASESIFSVLPLFLSEILFAGPISLGIIEGIAEATTGILKSISGAWSDRIQKKKRFVFVGYTLSNFTKPLMAFAQSWSGVLTLRFFDRVGKGIRTAPRDAWFSTMVAPEKLAQAFGFHRAMDNLGAVIGPVFAWYFLLKEPGHYRDLFLWAIIPGTIGTLIVLIPKEKAPPNPLPPVRREFPRTFLWPTLNSTLRSYLSTLFVFSVANASDAFLLLRLKEAGIATHLIPLLWGFLHVVKVIVSLNSGKICAKLGIRKTILMGWIVFTFTYLCFAYFDSKQILVPVFLVYGIFFGLTEGPERTLIAKLSSEAERGGTYGLYAMLSACALLPANLLFGSVWTWIGMESAFLSSAIISIIAILIFTARMGPFNVREEE